MRGGRKEGAGRPKGALNKTTLEQNAIKKEIHKRVLGAKSALINSQFNLAVGCSYLYKVPKIGSKTPIRVSNQKEIEKFLAGDFKEEGAEDYYFITTEKPDIRALQDFWDRVIGKPATVIEGGDDDKPLLIKLDEDERNKLTGALATIIGLTRGQKE